MRTLIRGREGGMTASGRSCFGLSGLTNRNHMHLNTPYYFLVSFCCHFFVWVNSQG